jgi:hypothetical protein
MSHWMLADEKSLVDFLHENKSEAGDGGSFKKATFQHAAQHIASAGAGGRVKDTKSCQNKWTAVSASSSLLLI